jgi:hypothetical protein
VLGGGGFWNIVAFLKEDGNNRMGFKWKGHRFQQLWTKAKFFSQVKVNLYVHFTPFNSLEHSCMQIIALLT